MRLMIVGMNRILTEEALPEVLREVRNSGRTQRRRAGRLLDAANGAVRRRTFDAICR